eukprot:scaffold191527_cov17-Tisochrysis_lutea.AAC.1
MTAGLLLHATIHPIPLPLLVQVVYASARRLPFAGVDITRYVADLLASRLSYGGGLRHLTRGAHHACGACMHWQQDVQMESK